MRRRPDRPAQRDAVCVLTGVGIAKAVERPDADPIRQRRLAEHKVPTLARPQVVRRERQDRECVVGDARLEDFLQ